jgi:hypothetical protein
MTFPDFIIVVISIIQGSNIPRNGCAGSFGELGPLELGSSPYSDFAKKMAFSLGHHSNFHHFESSGEYKKAPGSEREDAHVS